MGGGVGGGAGQRKEGSGEITRLGPCEVLQARRGGAEVAPTAPKGFGGKERHFYGLLKRQGGGGRGGARRRDVGSHVPDNSTVLDWRLVLVREKLETCPMLLADGVMELMERGLLDELSRRFLPQISSSFGLGSRREFCSVLLHSSQGHYPQSAPLSNPIPKAPIASVFRSLPNPCKVCVVVHMTQCVKKNT